MAFLPHDGKFYNYRHAYEHYGFQRIIDSVDRGRPDGWAGTDVGLVEDFTKFMGSNPATPFLAHVLLVENHGPHKCNAAGMNDIPVRLAGTDEFEPNCALHEYLRRLRSTTAAVHMLQDYLRAIGQHSGRPFVLLVYGDHQPFSFTGTGAVDYDFDPFRTGLGKNVTFFNLLTDTPGKLKCCVGAIPATLLPTLVSAYSADRPDDLYLGINLWLFDNCGPDAIGKQSLTWMSMTRARSRHAQQSRFEPADHRTEACKTAYERALTGIRDTGVIRGAPASAPSFR